MKVTLYAHGGSENHGCEAIVKSTISLLKNVNSPTLLSYDINQDIKYGLADIVTLKQEVQPINKKSISFIMAYIMQKLFKNYSYMDALMHKETINELNKMDISMFIGGDNYCYSDAKNYSFINRFMRKKTKKLVLWGTSVEPSLLNDQTIRKDIQQFDLIFARESISYEALKKVNQNTFLYPDPAFFLNSKECKLPHVYEDKDVIGINMSSLIVSHEKDDGITFKNYDILINYIISNTNYNIALIPHVIWKSNDDRIPLKLLYEKYKASKRVVLVSDHNCEEQKYLISKCRFFVGARTHATIAAYSSCVPTLVVGYSVKARGIAKDLFGSEEKYVLPVQHLKNNNDLKKAFVWIVEHEKDIKKQLELKINEYAELKDVYAKELYE